MSEIAVRQPVAELAVRDEPAGDLVIWANEARQAHEIALQLAETSFVPKAMYRKPGEVTGAILAGRELGLSPMSALRSIDIIDGTPAMRAHALRGLVQHHGHEVWVEESTEHRAIVCGKRRVRVSPFGGGGEHIERSTWTMDRARKAGLTGKKNWQAHPGAMLVARATAEVCRLIAADVLLGMPYTVEELTDDGVGPLGSDPQPSSARGPEGDSVPRKTKRTAQRAAPVDPAEIEPALPAGPDEPPGAEPAADVAPVIVEPPLPAEPAPVERAGWPDRATNRIYREPDPTPTPDETNESMITLAQSRKLHATFNDVGITDRAARLAAASSIVGRDVASSNELTKREARLVIDQLESDRLAAAAPPDADVGEVVDAEFTDADVDDSGHDDDEGSWRPIEVVDALDYLDEPMSVADDRREPGRP